ncbi:hypothetical protein BYT27DRAFT_7258941 [Phlegmacium glaucopus]|nr:hypothetical protein BYT27DRAFT_7258941 [Phlegmacium glaucopus]
MDDNYNPFTSIIILYPHLYRLHAAPNYAPPLFQPPVAFNVRVFLTLRKLFSSPLSSVHVFLELNRLGFSVINTLPCLVARTSRVPTPTASLSGEPPSASDFRERTFAGRWSGFRFINCSIRRWPGFLAPIGDPTPLSPVISALLRHSFGFGTSPGSLPTA